MWTCFFPKPHKLYKYLSTKGANDILASPEPSLWFRLPNKLNDIFDLCPVGYPWGFVPIGVFCLTETPISIPMWAHYGSMGQGVVLEFDVRLDFFTQYPPWKVRYQAKRPKVGNPKSIIIKSSEWAYEREWRCFMDLPQPSQKEKFLLKSQAVSIPFPFDALTAIIRGYDCVVDPRHFLDHPKAKHVQELVCRIDPWAYALNLRKLDDMEHISCR